MPYSILVLAALFIFNIYGCASAPYVSTPTPLAGAPGVYHRVQKGETLWRISKMYNVDLDSLIASNRVSDASAIETGQMIFIPDRKEARPPNYRYTNEEFIWPIHGKVISTFGQTFSNMINRGINIAPYQKLDVVASRSGRVVFYSENFGNFGKTIIIEHPEGFSTVYSRNSDVFVKVGDNVEKGYLIARAGHAGRDRLTYLHFEIRKGRISQNPLFYLP